MCQLPRNSCKAAHKLRQKGKSRRTDFNPDPLPGRQKDTRRAFLLTAAPGKISQPAGNRHTFLHKHAFRSTEMQDISAFYAGTGRPDDGESLFAVCFRPIGSLSATCCKQARNLLRPQPLPARSIPARFRRHFRGRFPPDFLSIFRYPADSLHPTCLLLQKTEAACPAGGNKPF